MKHLRHLTALALATTLLGSGPLALAESRYSFSADGTGTLTATARITLNVTVPKLLLLRVGTAGATVDALNWNTTFNVPSAPSPAVAATDAVATWTGVAPTTATTPAVVAVYAWTNNAAGANISYQATAFGANGPTLADISVTASAGLAHPLPTTLAASSTTATTITAGTVASSNWTYALSNTNAATWRAGTYSSTVTYTATSL